MKLTKNNVSFNVTFNKFMLQMIGIGNVTLQKK